MQAPETEPRSQRVLSFLSGLALALFGAARITPWVSIGKTPPWPVEALSLEPLLKSAAPPEILGSLGSWMTGHWEWLPVAAGLFAAGLFALANAVRARLAPGSGPWSALLVTAALCASPALDAFLRLEGARFLLAGAACALWSGFFVIGPRATVAAALAVVLAVGAALLHPIGAILALCAPLLLLLRGELESGKKLLRAGELVLAAGVAGALTAPETILRYPGAELSWLARRGLIDLLSAPTALLDGGRRGLIATGFEALRGDGAPVAALVAWGAVAALCLWRLGWRPLALGAVASLLVATLGALFVSGWVPGQRTGFVLFGLPLLALLPSALAFRAPMARNALLGLSLGLLVIGLSSARQREGDLVRRPRALGIPSEKEQFRPDLEPDPLRLGLFLHDVGPDDGYAGLVRQALRERLEAGAPAAAREALAILAAEPELDLRVGESPDLIPVRTKARDLLRVVQEAQGRFQRSGMEILPQVVEECRVLLPEILDLHFEAPKDASVKLTVDAFGRMLNFVSFTCTVVGRLDDSIALREGLYEMSDHEADHGAVLARHLRERGEIDRALALVEEILPKMKRDSTFRAMALGVKGQILLGQGKPEEALRALNPAFAGLSNATRHLVPAALDYWVVAEVALDRFLATKVVDPEFVAQARKDVDRYLEEPLLIGIRRVPALVFGARYASSEGKKERAVQLLEEMIGLETSSILERGDGERGRIDHPYYRRMGLRLFLELCGEAHPLRARARDALQNLGGA